MIDSNYGYDGILGVELSGGKTSFSVWAPLADSVALKLYKSGCGGSPLFCRILEKDDCGVWRYESCDDLKGLFYTYEYNYGGEVSEGVDPYARAVGINGERGCVVDLSETDPAGWDETGYVKLEKYTDAVLYELHVRDFSKDASSGIATELRGKYGAFSVENSRSPEGDPTCLEHIKKLGITHVHLLPVFDYDRLDESNPDGSYNWGYDPKNYNAPEGSYSVNPFDPALRINELKQLIMTLHKNGIGVVMDVVYNHTYLCETSNLGKSFPHYYYRYRRSKPSNGSGCGNEIASERRMARKYIKDSVLYWAKEYKIDGFRFDLMACLDVETLNMIECDLKKINPDAILYGEGWTGGECALDHEISACKLNACLTPGFAYFNDNYRDAIKGSAFASEALGYISGDYSLQSSVLSGLLGDEKWAANPAQIINYCESHDNLTLWDKLALSVGGCHERDRKKMSRLAAALVILAQGVPFIHAGQEFLRSKALGNEKYDSNSYRSSDMVNSLKWSSASANSAELEYYRGLIAFRKQHGLLRMADCEEVANHSCVLPSPDDTIEYLLFDHDEELLILINPIPRAKAFTLPDGEWQLHVSDTAVSLSPMATYCEGVFVPPISAMVLKKLKE